MKGTAKNRWIAGMKILAPIIVIFILFGTALQTGIVTINSPQRQKDLKEATEIKATVILDFGTDTNVSYSISTVNTTVYGCLLEAATMGNFNVKTTYYPSFDSTLVDAIGNATGGQDNKYWQYYINGVYGTLGVDKQTVHDGDRIEWKFAEFSS